MSQIPKSQMPLDEVNRAAYVILVRLRRSLLGLRESALGRSFHFLFCFPFPPSLQATRRLS